MDPILEQFLAEARENLEYLDQHLNELEDGDEESVNALFRAAHTLKGGAGLVGFMAVKEITHAAEDLLDAFRNKKVSYSQELLDTLYDAFDEVVELIDAAEELGSVEVEIDNEKIKEIESSIRGLLSSDDEKQVENEEVQTELNIDNELSISPLFSHSEIVKFISSNDIPVTFEKLSKEYLENDNFWLIDFDLDTETIKLGNDPLYLISLLGSNAIKCSGVEIADCSSLEDDVFEWISHLGIVVKSSEEQMVEAFYNILDEISFRALSIEALFDNEYDELEDDTLEEFKKEMNSLVSSKKYDIVDEKLSAVTQLINPKSYEGFILLRLQAILPNFDINSQKYSDILKLALKKMGVEIVKQEESKIVENESKQESQVDNPSGFSEKEINSALNILKAQQKVLSLAAKDPHVVDRTKLLLSNVLGFMKLDSKIEQINSVEELKSFVDETINKIDSSDTKATKESTQNELKQEKSKKTQPKAKQTQTKDTPKVTTHHKTTISKTVKIDQSKIDELMDIVGELLVMKNSLPYIADSISKDGYEHAKRELSTKYEEISRLTDQLQDKVMGMRLLPLEYIFGRYPKLVRDLSKKLGKKIKYEERGGETKLDKMVIEKLADPLVHIIRNSLDHGLETVEERKEAGKDETGTLLIEARAEGDKVFISISDDGRGIDEQKIVQKALEKQLVDPDSIDKMSKEEKLKLLFLPGLSTKEEVTDLSGRGVGTDAVKTTIDELGGNIYVESELGKGTKTTLELPLSVALTNVFHIKMNEVNYAIAMDYIVETEKIAHNEIKTANHKPFMRMRGELIPLVFEHILLGQGDYKKDIYSVVVINSNGVKFGLIVDEFVGQLDVVQKPLTGALANHPFISGTSLLGNGDVLFVLNPNKIVKV